MRDHVEHHVEELDHALPHAGAEQLEGQGDPREAPLVVRHAARPAGDAADAEHPSSALLLHEVGAVAPAALAVRAALALHGALLPELPHQAGHELDGGVELVGRDAQLDPLEHLPHAVDLQREGHLPVARVRVPRHHDDDRLALAYAVRELRLPGALGPVVAHDAVAAVQAHGLLPDADGVPLPTVDLPEGRVPAEEPHHGGRRARGDDADVEEGRVLLRAVHTAERLRRDVEAHVVGAARRAEVQPLVAIGHHVVHGVLHVGPQQRGLLQRVHEAFLVLRLRQFPGAGAPRAPRVALHQPEREVPVELGPVVFQGLQSRRHGLQSLRVGHACPVELDVREPRDAAHDGREVHGLEEPVAAEPVRDLVAALLLDHVQHVPDIRHAERVGRVGVEPPVDAVHRCAIDQQRQQHDAGDVESNHF
mmetsp:Transcript_95860/g.280198  ORF Transcript_95860/g.280198 Transcript_95860/m.280198 type:complete len:422 (+) Transcript_95860:1435-2700(+)